MTLRTQLVLAFLLLAVVPLSGLTLFSFVSSQRALRQAVEAESAEAAGQMSQRMEAVSRDIGSRFDRIGELPVSNWVAGGDGQAQAEPGQIYSFVLSALGDSAGLIDSLEVAPSPDKSGAGEPEPGAPPPAPPAPPKLVFVLPDGAPAPSVHTGPDSESVPHPEPGPRVVHAEGRTIILPPQAPGAPDGKFELRFDFKSIEEQTRKAIEAAEAGVAAAEAASLAEEELAKIRREQSAEAEFNIVLGETLDDKGHRGRGRIRAELNPAKVLKRVLGSEPAGRLWRTAAAPGEIPFAVDRQGHLFTPRPEDLQRIKGLSLEELAKGGQPRLDGGDWVVVARKDASSGLTLGIARPIAQPLAEIRNAALRNLSLGLGLIGLALVGILPLSNRITRNVKTLSQGAEKLAAGDLKARVPVRSRDELGKLAETFNRMAQDLELHQRQLVQQQLMQKELELCRHIQEEMLPKQSLRVPLAEVKGVSIPAREVGGDFFNYFPLENEKLAIVIGDVSGKGVAAALLMANVQATLKARLPLAGGLGPLAAQLDEEIARQTPPQTYLTLFMATLDLAKGTLRWVNAGHNPQYALRSDGGLTRLESGGRPLGLLPGGGFEEGEAVLRKGDSLFLYTDGLTEAADRFGEQFGQRKLEDTLVRESGRDLNAMLEVVEGTVRNHRQGADPGDDATMVVLKFGGQS